MILSIKAGGVGLNLTEANHVYHYDRWWNPAVENQATDRAYRIGQNQDVHVYKFITNGTLEEGIDQMIDQKKNLSDKVIGEEDKWITEMNDEEVLNLIRLREQVFQKK
jgi:SNF2 family DNA or RNA helicase